jgi:hypothetical protein
MGKQVSALKLVLAKQQAVFGTPESALLAADLVEAEKPEVQLDPELVQMEIVGGGHRNPLGIVGPYSGKVSLGIPLRNGATADTDGPWGMFLQACGWKRSLVSHVATYSPSDKKAEHKDLTLWGYSGSKDTTDSMLTKIGNIMGSAKFSLDFDKGIASMKFDGEGLFTAAPADATQPTTTALATVQAALKSATMSIFGSSALIPISFEFDTGEKFSLLKSPGTASGFHSNVLADRKIGFSVKFFKEAATTFDVYSAFMAGTTSAISFSWGAAPQKFTFTLSSVQMKAPKVDEQNGVETFTIEGNVIDNAMTIATDLTVV